MVVDGALGPAFESLTYPLAEDDPAFLKQMAEPERDDPRVGASGGGSGPRAGPNIRGSMAFSPDSKHIAYAAKKDGKWLIMYDGKPEPPTFDTMPYLFFSPDSEHFAWLQTSAQGMMRFTIDGKEGPEFDSIPYHQAPSWDNIPAYPYIQFSPDGRTSVYLGLTKAGTNTVASLVVNNVPRPVPGSVQSVAIRPDGKTITYVSIEGREGSGKQCVVVDGERGPEFDKVWYNPKKTLRDGVVYQGWKGGDVHLVVNGQVGPGFRNIISNLEISPDGKRLAYAGVRNVGTNWDWIAQLFLDGKAWPEEKTNYHLTFSPDNLHFGVVTEFGGRGRVIVDGQPGPEAKGLEEIHFAPVGGRFFYRTGWSSVAADPRRLAVDFEPAVDFYHMNWPVFSPDGQRLAYVAGKGDKYFLVVDGKTYAECEKYTQVVFSPDSRRIAYSKLITNAKDGSNKYVVMLDGVAGSVESDNMTTFSPLFSTDSRHVAYGVIQDKRWRIVVDDVPGPLLEQISAGPVITAKGQLQYFGLRKDGGRHNLVRYTVNGFGPSAPVTTGPLKH
jgi:hypothetical protein